ncbi:MAG: hypothetical protein QW575_07350 [Thermoproteota archaeon]
MTKNEVIEVFRSYLNKTQGANKKRLYRDILELQNLQDSNYAVVVRQYTGHKILPKRIYYNGSIYEPVFISSFVIWESKNIGSNLVVIDLNKTIRKEVVL